MISNLQKEDEENWEKDLEVLTEDIEKLKESRNHEYKRLNEGSFQHRAGEKRNFLK